MNQENQILSPELEARVHQAVENFMQGYGCCQSVVAAFADLYGLDETMAKRSGAGCGGGVGDHGRSDAQRQQYHPCLFRGLRPGGGAAG